MKKIVTLLLLTSTLNGFGQSAFNYKNDFKKILARTKDAGDSLSYQKLLNRFAHNDTALTDFEVLSLLIGFTDMPEYRPYQDIDIESEIYDINADGNHKQALEKANEFLKTHPLSVKVLFEKSYSFHKLGQEDSSSFYKFKGQRIFKAMYYSGEGTTRETPTFALGPADGQDYIVKFLGGGLGRMGSGQDPDGNFLDILDARFENRKTITFYFIIQHATDKMFSAEDMKMIEDALKKAEEESKKEKK